MRATAVQLAVHHRRAEARRRQHPHGRPRRHRPSVMGAQASCAACADRKHTGKRPDHEHHRQRHNGPPPTQAGTFGALGAAGSQGMQGFCVDLMRRRTCGGARPRRRWRSFRWEPAEGHRGQEFSHDTGFVLLDNPTRGLDVGSIEFIHRQILNKRSGRAGVPAGLRRPGRAAGAV